MVKHEDQRWILKNDYKITSPLNEKKKKERRKINTQPSPKKSQHLIFSPHIMSFTFHLFNNPFIDPRAELGDKSLHFFLHIRFCGSLLDGAHLTSNSYTFNSYVFCAKENEQALQMKRGLRFTWSGFTLGNSWIHEDDEWGTLINQTSNFQWISNSHKSNYSHH